MKYTINGREVSEEEFRSHNTPNRLEEMLNAQRPPQVKSANTFMRGNWGATDTKDKEVNEHYRKIAKEAGVSTDGARYISDLARFPGDPEAWVDNWDTVPNKIKERGWGCEDLNIKNDIERGDAAPTPQEPKKLADDLIDDAIGEEIAVNPSLVTKPKEELSEMVQEKYGDPYEGLY